MKRMEAEWAAAKAEICHVGSETIHFGVLYPVGFNTQLDIPDIPEYFTGFRSIP